MDNSSVLTCTQTPSRRERGGKADEGEHEEGVRTYVETVELLRTTSRESNSRDL
jgi:hypothetical protein